MGARLLAKNQAESALSIVYFHDYPPFSWTDNGDPVKGIFVDILEEALHRRLGIKTNHVGLPWGRAQQLVRLGKADAMCTVFTPDREVYCKASKNPVIRVPMRIYTSHNHPNTESLRQIKSLSDLDSYRVASYIGNGWAERHLGKLNVTWTRTLEQTMKMVALQRVDVSVDPEPVAQFFINKLGYRDRLKLIGSDLDQVDFKLLMRRDSPYIDQLAQFDETIEALRLDGTVKKIQDSYLTS